MDMNTAVVDFGSDCCFAQDSLSFTNTKEFRGTSISESGGSIFILMQYTANVKTGHQTTLLNTTEYNIDDPGNNRIF